MGERTEVRSAPATTPEAMGCGGSSALETYALPTVTVAIVLAYSKVCGAAWARV